MERLTENDPAEIGRYRSIAELGKGGMGRVLLSSAPDGGLVALKQVRAQFVEDDGFRARFRREVAASRKVSGAHTSAVIDADADAEEPWLTSEFVPGPSLQEAVTAVGALPEEAVLRMAAGLAAALVDIHGAGLVHRDLKPSNVLLTDEGPRVIDFGIARATEGGSGTELTRSGGLVGSPGFMSPEQAQGQPIGPASDVFSLGTVLFMACTGTCPFNGPSVPGTLYNIVYAEPDLGALPAKVRPLVARCLAKDPAARPSPARLLDDIGRIARTARPWPAEVHELIAAQQAEIARLQEELELRTRELADLARDGGGDGDDGDAVVIEAPSAAPEPVSGPARPRLAVLAGTAVAVAALTAAAVIALDPGGGGDTRTVERPPRATAPVEPTPDRTPEQPSPEATTEAPVEQATRPETGPSAVREPSRRPPTRIETRPSTRPAAIADCEGKRLTRPDSLLLACGDGKAGLLNLVWSGWGTPVARATGLGWHVVCEPSCANGREVRYQVTVTATGPTAGRYTLMRINAPGTPDPVRLYTLDENGPTSRA
ncbi:serine/threonine-protein kinase [Streptomyces formicae]|uniref:Putative serine/threonine protein kinase n=1 Tax=Streptomyces formicae TaxID=1616117 RepID=A0A291QHK2_9ACTN|nr:serine/threonine-protein kinase [Streptomyces formicae]ATL31199.1 putative serine/threonine protein kinase [Streptomyces formicae]